MTESRFSLVLRMPVTDEEIRMETSMMRAEIALRQAEIKMLSQGIKHYQDQCKHEGQKTGSDSRDGSWASPCPVCGYSY